MRKIYAVVAIGVVVILAAVFGFAALGVTFSGESAKPVVTERMSSDLALLSSSLAAQGLNLDSASMGMTNEPGYILSFSGDSWVDVVEGVDIAFRVASEKKVNGELSEDVLYLRVTPPPGAALPPSVKPGEPASLDFRLQDFDPTVWDFYPDVPLDQVRERVVPKVRKLAAEHEIELSGADVVARAETYCLDVQVTIDPASQLEDLSLFAEQLWGIVPGENAVSKSIGLGRLQVSDVNGDLLAFDLNDFIVSWRQVHSDINYPFAYRR